MSRRLSILHGVPYIYRMDLQSERQDFSTSTRVVQTTHLHANYLRLPTLRQYEVYKISQLKTFQFDSLLIPVRNKLEETQNSEGKTMIDET